MEFEGKMIVVTAPSGAGKTTIVKYLLEKMDNLDFSISATTRDKRPYEVDGKDYFFITKEQFEELIAKKAFAEYEIVYEGQYYGTLAAEIERIWQNGKHIIFDIDVQGALTLKRKYMESCLTIFIRPPSKELLIERLTNRQTESPEALKKRIDKAEKELGYESLFDFVLINDQLEVACFEAETVVHLFLNPEIALNE
ncbi:MAG: guanylate kinase [Saprospiraceae bacterium]|nr:guanylate kinase [Saprospiraceae bacterium]MBX7177955.1 guanylate kinase [Saprospiraceae bacterium]MCB0591962.1 guanylate kinase [Saprospiraceae bacterium]MCO5284387.1 guanylate kinase [Saprospiraceae bacterium]MCO6471280.1 guanylate kinase [Saprospiraceae bacterium]